MKPDEVQSAPSLAAEYTYDTDEDVNKDDKDQKIVKLERRVKELEAKVTDLQKQLDKSSKQTTQDEGTSEDEKSVAESPVQKKQKRFQRQTGLLVFACDSDNPNAEQYPAFYDDVDFEDDEDHVWIRWASNIGRRVRVPKSRIKSDNFRQYKGMYAWCEKLNQGVYGDLLYMIPYEDYLFWRRLPKCKTWGEIKAIASDEYISMLTNRYEMRCERYDGDELPRLDDDTEIDFSAEGSFCLMEHESYGDCTPYGTFPPMIDDIMAQYRESHLWMCKFGKCDGGWNNEHYRIQLKEKETMFKDMSKHSRAAIHCPQLEHIFPSVFDFG